MKKYLIILSALHTLNSNAHEDALEWKVSTQATISSGDNNPFWLNANRFGLSSTQNNNGYMRASLAKETSVDSLGRFTWGGMIDMAATYNHTSSVIIQQAFVEGRWKKGVLTIGSKEYPMELKS